MAPDRALQRYRQLYSAREALLAEMMELDACATASLHDRRRRIYLATLHREIGEEMAGLLPAAPATAC